MQSKATTVKQYLDELPEERRKAIRAVRREIRKNLPKGYEEAMNWGMISYQVPLRKYPETYNGQPLVYAALASQKNHMAVYLSAIYMHEKTRKKFETDYKATGKRMDIGKSCVRFRKIEDLPLPLIGKAIALMSVDRFIDDFEKVRSKSVKRGKKK